MENPKVARKLAILNQSIPHIEGFMGPGLCSGYAVRAAKRMYRLDYNPGHAWDLAGRNNAVPFEPGKLRKGCILGIKIPGSPFHRDGRNYTHVALYVGGNIVLHNSGGKVCFEHLPSFLERKKSEVVDIIKPAGGMRPASVRMP